MSKTRPWLAIALLQMSISAGAQDAVDHGPQELTRSYYDRYGNRHEIVNKCWGIFC